MVQPFEGRLFRCGMRVAVSDLRPTADYPEVPLLIEYAGNDASGSGHNRSNDIHLLWRYQAGAWVELARVASQGREWVFDILPIVQRELAGAPVHQCVADAEKVSQLVLGVLDRELLTLAGEGRSRALSFLWDELAARLVA